MSPLDKFLQEEQPAPLNNVKGIHKLLTTEDVAKVVGVTARGVRKLEIPFVRIGRLRRYDRRDVEAYIRESKKWPSSKDQGPRTTIRSSKSEGIGFAAALKQHPIEKRSR